MDHHCGDLKIDGHLMRSAQYQDLNSLNLRQKLCLAAEELCSPILQNLPFFLGSPFRCFFLKVFSKGIGKEVFIAQNVSLRHCFNLTIGSYVGINQDTIIHARGSVVIGDHVFIGQRVIINTGDHEFSDRDVLIREQKTTYKPVKIGNDVFIGMGALILPGIEIGNGCVIAAGAVVCSNTDPYCVYGGVPARKIKERTAINEVKTKE
jgi:acetyltransferase-like isoleucine patch superfamily enzyme